MLATRDVAVAPNEFSTQRSSLFLAGGWSRSDRRLFVGAHPSYARRRDIEIQTRLVRPDVSTSASTLEELAAEVLDGLGAQHRQQE